MKIYRITILIVVLAMLGGTFTVDAKAKKRRSTTKKEKQIQQKKDVNCKQSVLDMVECSHQGMEMSPISQVRVERKDGKVVCVIKGTRSSNGLEYVIPDGDEILKDALEIIEQEKMLDYESEYEPDPNNLVSDGFSWSFKAKLADGRSVSSKGHNAGPDGLYSEGADKLTELLFERARKCGLNMVEYGYQGMRMDPLAHMRVERRGGKVVMVIKGTTTDEKEYVIKDGERILYEALGIIEEENMLEYDKIYTFKTEPGERILDGYSWSFAAKLKDGRSVSSKGSNAEPSGKGLNRIGTLLRTRAEKLLEEDQKQKIEEKPEETVVLNMIEYKSWGGKRVDPYGNMRVERKDNKVVMIIKGTTTDEKEFVINDGEQLLKDALAIIKEEKMLDSKESSSVKAESDKRFLDRASHSFLAILSDGRRISSYGYRLNGEGFYKIITLLTERAQKLLENKD